MTGVRVYCSLYHYMNTQIAPDQLCDDGDAIWVMGAGYYLPKAKYVRPTTTFSQTIVVSPRVCVCCSIILRSAQSQRSPVSNTEFCI